METIQKVGDTVARGDERERTPAIQQASDIRISI